MTIKENNKRILTLLQKVKAAIKRKPQFFVMQWWFTFIDDDGTVIGEAELLEVNVKQIHDQLKGSGKGDCGTACCIGGWMTTFMDVPKDRKLTTHAAFEIADLRMPDVGSKTSTASALFSIAGWHKFASPTLTRMLTIATNKHWKKENSKVTGKQVYDKLSMYEFDRFPHATRQRIAIRAIDDYIDKYLGDLK